MILSQFLVEKTLGILKSERRKIKMFGGDDAREIYLDASRRHPKLPLVRKKSLGAALAEIPQDPGAVFRGKRFHEARRKRNRALKEGYSVRKVASLDYVKRIHAINVSAPIRQNRPVDDYMATLDAVERYCEKSSEIYGVFDRAGELQAYSHGTLCGEVFVLDRFIGHCDTLKHGVMFLLMHAIYIDLVEMRQRSGYPHFVQHDMYYVPWPGIRQFKKEAGFFPYRVVWKWDDRKGRIPDDVRRGSAAESQAA